MTDSPTAELSPPERRALLAGGAALGVSLVLAPHLPLLAATLAIGAAAIVARALGSIAAPAIGLAGVAAVVLGHGRTIGDVFDAVSVLAIGLVLARVAADDGRARRALGRAASTDPLTCLWNRRGLALEVERALAVGGSVGVLDLDGLKRLNDTHGHAAGDRAIVALAEVLRAGRSGDVVARLGGDELAIVLPETSLPDARGVLARACAAFRARATAEGWALDVSVGVAPLGDTLADALGEADAAMYREKRAHQRVPAAPLRAAWTETPVRRPRRHVRFGLTSIAAAIAFAAFGSVASAQARAYDRALTGSTRSTAPVESASGLASPHAPSSSVVRLELLGGATVPVDVGFRARIVLFDRVVFGLALGVGTYGDVAREIARTAGASTASAQIAHDLASGLLTGELSLGVRPVEGSGFELALGYAILQHQLALDGPTVASAFGVQSSAPDVATSYLLHAIHGEIAWTIVLLDHFVLRPAIGWLHVLAADVSFAVDGADATAQAMLDAAASEVRPGLTTWGMTPTLSLSIGYRF